jgi:hypothetical protein
MSELLDAFVKALLPWVPQLVGAAASMAIGWLWHRAALYRAAHKALSDAQQADGDDDEITVQKAATSLAASVVGKLAGASGRVHAARRAMKKIRDSQRPPPG